MNRPRLSPLLRLQFLGLLMLLGLGALAVRLWWVQVARGAEWTARIRGSSEATVRIPSVRGEIRDRNGTSLVQNRASYEVDFYLPEMVKGYRQRYGQPPLTVYRGNVSGMPKDLKEADIVKIVNDGIVPHLYDLALARDYNAGQLQKHYRTNTEVPYTYIKDIDFPTMAKFSEHDVGLPGVDLAIKPVRSYVYGAFAAHLLGYVGAPDDINKEDAKKYTFYQGDMEGKSNIEKLMDEYLRGKPGVRHLRRNAKGQIDGVLKEDPPQQGANVFLTLDARIQSIAEEALRAVSRAGAVGLADALKVSGGSFFYQYGNAAGIQSIDLVGKLLGMGAESGLHLSGEQTGNMPGPEWMQVHHPQERWSQAQTANVSIGQGYTLVSPLQLAMAYATIANGGVCYYPRLVDRVLKQDGLPVLDEHGNVAVPETPRVRSDLRQEISPEKIELVRKGLWKVVNEDGGTGGRARLKDWVVAGKTGTAQATDRGHEENVAWFACFAPYDHPKYVVAVMVQGASGHGGEVAGPIATRILERTLAQDEGKYDMQVAWLAPAHKANPLQLIKSVAYHDTGGNLGSDDEEDAGDSQTATAQMASSDASPDVEPEADTQGKVRRQGPAVARALPAATPAPRNFFQRIFGMHPRQAPPPPPPNRRRGTPPR